MTALLFLFGLVSLSVDLFSNREQVEMVVRMTLATDLVLREEERGLSPNGPHADCPSTAAIS